MTETNDSTQNTQLVESSSSNNYIEELFQKGLFSYQKGHISDAIEIFKNIIEQKPDWPEAYVNLGDAYYKIGEITEAINYWKKALSINPSLAVCYINIGNAHCYNGNIDDALPHWHVAITILPDNTTALLNLGTSYEKLGDESNAFKYYEQYLNYSATSNSKDYEQILKKVTYAKRVSANYFNSGIKYQQNNEFKKAVSQYLQSIKIYPNYPKTHLNLGNICYKAQKYRQAVKFWFQTIKLDPKEENIYCNLGVAYEKLKKYNYAYCMYDRFLNITNKHTITNLNIQRRMDEIRVYLNKHPEVSKKHLELAEEYHKRKKYYEALWEYENYAILKPDQLSAYEYKITELRTILEPLKKALKEAIETGDRYFEEKNYDLAIKAYRRCMYLQPKGEYAEFAYKKILECSKHRARKF